MKQQVIKAIETAYNGYLFRSRLEARWAVFFDALGIRYEYEPQGFEIDPGWKDYPPWNYLPDFCLPDFGTWVEVKGNLDDVTDDYLAMIAWAIDWGGQLPGVAESSDTTRGLLWLGPVPRPCSFPDSYVWEHVIFQHRKGGWINLCTFEPGNKGIIPYSWHHAPSNYFDSTWGTAGCAEAIRPALRLAVYDRPDTYPVDYDALAVNAAYTAARSARFEHDQTPRHR
jgi:hypothetical protein